MKKFIYLIFITTFLFSQLSRSTDSLALVKLYQETNGNGWTNNTNWLSDKPISEWFGVTVINNRVNRISLRDNSLFGQLPDEIGNFSEITYISLTTNVLIGTLPTTIGNLKKLWFLSVSKNSLSGEVPASIASIDSLRNLYIYDNLFTKLGNLSTLKTNILFAENNKFTFTDIIQNISVLTRYAPQKTYTTDIDSSGTEGQFYQYEIPSPDPGITNSTYQWYKDGILMDNQTTNTLKISSLKISDNGEYICKIKNEAAPELELVSGKLFLTVDKANAPATPYSLFTASSETEVFINWNFPEDSLFKYFYFYLDTLPNPTTRVDSLFDEFSRSFTISNLKPATTYYIRMTAKNTLGIESHYSSESIITTWLGEHETGYSLNAKIVDHESLANSAYNDIWGFERGNKDYVIISKTYGFAVYEVEANGNAVLKMHENSANNDESGWGEVRFYNDYVYKATEHGPIRIFKLDFVNDTSIFIKSFGQDAHNISLNKNSLLACGGFYKGVKSWDITDPENPVSQWHYNQYYVHDFVVQNDTIYMAELYESNFAIYDISNVTDTTLTENYLVKRHHYENGFTHNIWPTEDSKYVVTSDEHDQFDHMQVWDIQNLNNIKNVLRHREGESSVVHNAFIKRDFIYTSYYTKGFIMYDMSDPELIVKVAEYDADPENDTGEFKGTWGVYPFMNNGFVALSNRETGLDIVQIDTTKYAGTYEIVVMDSKGVPYTDGFQVSSSDLKSFKYKIKSNKILMKAVPDNSKQFKLTFPALNYSKNYDHFFALNSNKSDTVFLDQEVSFITNLSFFQNPLINQFLTISYTSEEALIEKPFLTVTKDGKIDTITMEDGIANKNYSVQYKLTSNDDYKFFISAKTATSTKTENRTLAVVSFKEKIIDDFSILNDNLKITLDINKPIYIISEQREYNEYLISPGITFENEVKLSFKIPNEFQTSNHLFVYKLINKEWKRQDSYLKNDELIIYTNELGLFKVDYDQQFKNFNVPDEYELKQNFPNPFNPRTTIKYDVAKDGNVEIFIYNILGQKVKKLVNSFHKASSGYQVIWDARNDNGIKLSSGVYFYQIRSGSFIKSKKMILVK